MGIATHCLPNGSLGTGQIPVPAFPGPAQILIPTGSKRGVVIWCHGVSGAPVDFPYPLFNIGLPPYNPLTLCQNLQTDGWVVIAASEPGDSMGNAQIYAITNDFSNDSGKGSRLANTQGLWADHLYEYCAQNYPNMPIVIMGASWGGYTVLQLITKRTSYFTAYAAHVPAAQPWVVNLGGALFPWIGTPDASYTLASSMNGKTLPQSTITVNETISGLPQSGSLVVAASPTYQIVCYTSWSGSTFSGVTGGDNSSALSTNGSIRHSTFSSGSDLAINALATLGNGQQGSKPFGFIGCESGDVTVGYAIPQAMYNAASGSQPVTLYTGTGIHGVSTSDVTALTNWVTNTVDPACPAIY